MVEKDAELAEARPGAGAFEKDPKEFRVGRGSWLNGAYHMATTIATPAAFAALPFALASLGWEAGVITLVVGTAVTCYCSFLIASLWDYERKGKRNISYGALAHSIFGSVGYWAVVFFQQIASIGNNITIQIVAGISMKAVYKTYHPNGSLTLQEFIIIFGVAELLFSQLPDIHSLRLLNLLCTICTVGFSITAVGLSIYNGKELRKSDSQAPPIRYGLGGFSSSDKLFGIFNALGTVAFSFGDAMLPEIQATLREPARPAMYRSISMAYSIIALTYWTVAFVGYWAFGQDVAIFLVNSFTHPNWAITVTYIFAVIQVSGCYQTSFRGLTATSCVGRCSALLPSASVLVGAWVCAFLRFPPGFTKIYCRPSYGYLEYVALDHSRGVYNWRNAIKRLVITSVYVVLITLVACALPFFGDFLALCGAVGFTPLDFIIPILAFVAVRRPKNPLFLAFNVIIAALYTVVAILGATGAIRSINRNVNTYDFFSDI